jgi:hypothetical protein
VQFALSGQVQALHVEAGRARQGQAWLGKAGRG